MIIRKAKINELDEILAIYELARSFMVKNGNPHQWNDEKYPPAELLKNDIEKGNLYVAVDEQIEGVFYFAIEEDEDYKTIDGAWLNDKPYAVIHRIASSGRVKGIVKMAVEFAKSKINNVKIDTHSDNYIMQRALEKLGFQKCGTIYLKNNEPRIAYQLNNSENIC